MIKYLNVIKYLWLEIPDTFIMLAIVLFIASIYIIITLICERKR